MVSLRTFLIVAAAVVLLGLGAGFLLDADSFVPNLLAEMVGVAAAFLLAVALVDKLQQRDRERRWSRVRRETADALAEHLRTIAVPFYIRRPALGEPHVLPLTGDQPRAVLEHLIALMKRIEDALDALATGTEDASSGRAFRAAEPALRELSVVFIPRLMSLEGTPRLLEALLRLEKAGASWRQYVQLSESFGPEGPHEFAWARAAMTLAAVTETWRVLTDEVWQP